MIDPHTPDTGDAGESETPMTDTPTDGAVIRRPFTITIRGTVELDCHDCDVPLDDRQVAVRHVEHLAAIEAVVAALSGEAFAQVEEAGDDLYRTRNVTHTFEVGA